MKALKNILKIYTGAYGVVALIVAAILQIYCAFFVVPVLATVALFSGLIMMLVASLLTVCIVKDAVKLRVI